MFVLFCVEAKTPGNDRCSSFIVTSKPVLWIRIRTFLGLQDPSIIKQKSKKSLDHYFFVTSVWILISEDWCKCTVPWHFDSHWRKEQDPEPYQNVKDPQHCLNIFLLVEGREPAAHVRLPGSCSQLRLRHHWIQVNYKRYNVLYSAWWIERLAVLLIKELARDKYFQCKSFYRYFLNERRWLLIFLCLFVVNK